MWNRIHDVHASLRRAVRSTQSPQSLLSFCNSSVIASSVTHSNGHAMHRSIHLRSHIGASKSNTYLHYRPNYRAIGHVEHLMWKCVCFASAVFCNFHSIFLKSRSISHFKLIDRAPNIPTPQPLVRRYFSQDSISSILTGLTAFDRWCV